MEQLKTDVLTISDCEVLGNKLGADRILFYLLNYDGWKVRLDNLKINVDAFEKIITFTTKDN